MKLTLREHLSQFSQLLQGELFPILEERTGKLDGPAKRLVAILALIPLSRFVPVCGHWIGRPSKDRLALASAFVAKAVYGFGLTRQLLERLQQDAQLRQICGWRNARQVPHESTFSRAFAEFADMELPQLVHEALVADTQKERLIGHIARDSTAINAHEKLPASARKAAIEKTSPKARRKPGPKNGSRGAHKRWKGGQPQRDCRLHRQRSMNLAEMLQELPTECSIGAKKNSQGIEQYWRGYKLHLDVADGQIPISAILTSARVHDSQVAIPLSTITAQRVTSLYDLMDAAYDAREIKEHSQSLGHVPIIASANRLGKKILFQNGREPARQLSWAEQDRFETRTMVERVYARLKEEFGGRQVRVRGPKKVMAHLMFGLLALTADQVQKLIAT
jgi:hypothetical protein